MSKDEQDLRTALHAMALENEHLRAVEKKASHQLAELQLLVQKVSGDLYREGAGLSADSKLAVDASSAVLDLVMKSGDISEIRAAEDLRRLVVSLHASAWNIRSYATYFQTQLSGFP